MVSNVLSQCKNYISKRKLAICERAFWFVGFLLSSTMAGFLTYELWDKYTTSPVITTFQATETSSLILPFPAVTLCNGNRLPASVVEKLVRDVQDTALSNDEIDKMKGVLSYMQGDCDWLKDTNKLLENVERRYNILDTDVRYVLNKYQNELASACGDFITFCETSFNKKNCSEVFRPIWTDTGLCCTFNMMPTELLFKTPQDNKSSVIDPVKGFWSSKAMKEWSEWDYAKLVVSADPNVGYPWRPKKASVLHGLKIKIQPPKDEVRCSLVQTSNGIYFTLHNSLSLAYTMHFPALIGFGQEVHIRVATDLTVAERNLEEVSIAKRGCIFSHEKELDIIRPYTRDSCQYECMDKMMIERCNCSFLLTPIATGVPICVTLESDNDCPTRFMEHITKVRDSLCVECLSLCEDLSYTFQITTAGLPPKRSLSVDSNHSLILNFYRGSDMIVPKLRKQVYGKMDLIANMGGIFGLCLGFSILSGVEILYHCCYQFWKNCCRIRKARRKTEISPFDSFKLKGAKEPINFFKHQKLRPIYPRKF